MDFIISNAVRAKRHWSLFLCMGAAACYPLHALAVTLSGPTASATVNAGDVAQNWAVSDGATLNVTPGGQTLQLTAARGATLNLDGATVTAARFASAMQLSAATATVLASTLSSDTSNGIVMVANNPSVLTLVSSTVNGVGQGAALGAGNQLIATDTQINGADDGRTGADRGGVGLYLTAAQASLLQGSSAIGANHGAVLVATTASPAATDATLVVDDSTVQGLRGSAVLVGSASSAASVNATLTLDNGAALIGGNGVAVEAVAGSVLGLQAQASTLQGSLIASGGAQVNATLAQGSALIGDVLVSQASGVQLDLSNSSLKGNVTVADSSSAELQLQASSWTGNANGVASIALSDASSLTGQLTQVNALSLAQGSTWDLTGDSQVGALSLNASQIRFNGSSGAYRTLQADSLTGNGSFALNTDLAAAQGDRLVVSGQADGDYQLLIHNSNNGADPVAGSTLTVVQTVGGPASFTLAGGEVDAGTFVYDLQKNGTDWSLVQRETDKGEEVVTPGTRSILGLFSAAPTVWYGELTTLRSRMGELRLGHGASGPWVRTYGSQYNVSADAGVSYQQRQHGITFGLDTPLPSDTGQWLVGVLGGYSRSDLDLGQGTSGQVDSYYAGLYSTWLSDTGYYIDGVIKLNRFQNDSTVHVSDGSRTKGHYGDNGVGASLEVGKHIKLAHDWFIEPFAQFSALRVQGRNYDLDNGLQASSHGDNSLLGKIGTHLGRNFALSNGGVLQPYIKVAGAQEFAKSNRIRVNDNSFNNDISGGRAELGTGVIAQLAGNLQLQADFDYSHGRHLEQPWGASVGVRYAW
jgi:outer membrane autotransporter protein